MKVIARVKDPVSGIKLIEVGDSIISNGILIHPVIIDNHLINFEQNVFEMWEPVDNKTKILAGTRWLISGLINSIDNKGASNCSEL